MTDMEIVGRMACVEVSAGYEHYIAMMKAFRQSVSDVDAKDAEVARLQSEVEHRLNEMNLQARWTREAQDEAKRLRAALKPFAEFAKAFNANPLKGVDDALYSIHGGAGAPSGKGAELRLTDCHAALNALEGK